MPSRLQFIGIGVSAVAVAAVVYWASKQEAPELPSTSEQVLALIGAIGLYALNTCIRAERWHRLLVHDGARPTRTDSYALTVIGYTGNNVLPARAGDAVRVVLLAPRAQTSKRTVIGTLLAERLLDIVVVVLLFVVVGYAIIGEIADAKLELMGAATVAILLGAWIGYRLVQRNERLSEFVRPMLTSTLNLIGSRHGAVMLGITLAIWAVEAGVWMAVGSSVGFGMDPIEGLYLVALASVFSLIPSGPAYLGTQDGAAVIGIKAIGGTSQIAFNYLLMLRFVLVVPITSLGFLLLAARYGGLSKLRSARIDVTGQPADASP